MKSRNYLLSICKAIITYKQNPGGNGNSRYFTKVTILILTEKLITDQWFPLPVSSEEDETDGPRSVGARKNPSWNLQALSHRPAPRTLAAGP